MKNFSGKTELFLALVGVLLYVNTINHGFVLDDAIVFSENSFTTLGLEGWKGIFSKDTFFGFFQQEGKEQLVAGGRYRPLSLATFALEVSLFGVQPLSGHLLNAIFYGLLGAIVYRALLLLKIEKGLALAVALLFLTHPLHTEVVANIKGRDEILSLMFALLALQFYLRQMNKDSLINLMGSGIFYFLALLSKENGLTFIAILPLAAWFIGENNWKKIIIGLLPVLAVTIVFLWIRKSIIGDINLSASMEWMNNPFLKIENNVYVLMDSWESWALILQSWMKYQQLLIVPFPLSHDYYPMTLPKVYMWSPVVILSIIFHLGLLIFIFRGWSRRKLFSFGMLYFLLTFSIVSNVIFPIGTQMSERFMFMPSLGWLLAVTSTANLVVPDKWKKMILGMVLLIFASLTFSRNLVWKSNYTLFSNDIEVVPNSAKINNGLGGVLIEKSLDKGQINKVQLESAIGYLEKAIAIHPNYKNAHLLNGNAHLYLNDYEKAILNYQNALAIDPNYQEAINNLSIAYRDGGRYYGEQEANLEKAMEWLNQSYQINPQDYETIRLLGVAYGSKGLVKEALNWFLKAVELAPENGSAWYNLGVAYYNLGMVAKGDSSMQKAKQLDPSL